MRKTIGFFGDSFCAGREPESWCVLLANQLNAQITHWGEPGRSIWSTFFKFNQLNKTNRLPDICVLCYTEPYRLYHTSLILSANTEPVEGVDPKIYEALEQYWIHLHNYDKDELAYEYAVKWFDHDVLSKIKNKTIVQMWSFRPFETAGKDADIKLKSGIFIDESLYSSSLTENNPSGGATMPWGSGIINHMNEEQNKLWADKVYTIIKNNESRS
jgi:hypothetical protein